MNIQLIEGEFKSTEALNLITQLMHVKIQYQENKISNSATEEDIKAREAKIKKLQKELFEFRNQITSKENAVRINATINID